jgi:hypothetical protein
MSETIGASGPEINDFWGGIDSVGARFDSIGARFDSKGKRSSSFIRPPLQEFSLLYLEFTVHGRHTQNHGGGGRHTVAEALDAQQKIAVWQAPDRSKRAHDE